MRRSSAPSSLGGVAVDEVDALRCVALQNSRRITIRVMDAQADRAGVEAIDTAFEAPTVFELVVTPRRIELAERTLEVPLLKRYPIDDAFAFWVSWDAGWVAVD